MKPKMLITLSQYRFSCGGPVSSWPKKPMLKIRHEKGKVDTFDPKLFREKLEVLP